VVEHKDRSLELITLYVVTEESALIDSDGKLYKGGLPDFRRHNDLLSSTDWMVAPDGITAVPGSGAIVEVTGHTPKPGTSWPLMGGAAGGVVIVVAAGTLFYLMRRRGPRPNGGGLRYKE